MPSEISQGPEFGDLDLESRGLGVVAPEDVARAEIYGLLSRLLIEAPGEATLSALASLEAQEGPLAEPVGALARVAAATTPHAAAREYDALFIGLGRGELLPYASYYLTGFLNEKPLAKLRDSMGALGLARTEGRSEPEDHIASICEMMAGLIGGAYGLPADIQTQTAFFKDHIAPWAKHFFDDLAAAKKSTLYAPVGTLGARFMEIEAEAFRLQG